MQVKPKIYYSIPWSTDKNLGQYYNAFMSKLDDDEYACFVDGDACFTVTHFGKQFEDIVEKYPECGLFTAKASRIGCMWQRAGNPNSDNIWEHREIGKRIAEKFYNNITDVSKVDKGKVLGGVLILISKKVWKKLGGFKEEGILGIDNDIHWKAMEHNEKVYLMEGVYLYHWYRGGNMLNNSHLKGENYDKT